MARIPFDIKYRPQIESGEYKVESRDGRPARIICWDMDSYNSIVALLANTKAWNGKEQEYIISCTKAGLVATGAETSEDLFIVTREEELTEFEKAIKEMMRSYVKMPDEVIKETAAELLDLATKEIGHKWVIRQESYQDGYINGLHDGKAEALKDLEESGRVHCKSYDIGYDDGKKETLKNLPRWSLSTGCFDKGWVDNGILYYKFHAIPLNTLEKLPEFKED